MNDQKELQSSGLHVIERRSRTADVHRGDAWKRWLDDHMTKVADVPPRAALYGFMMSLFRLDWDRQQSMTAQRSLAGLPRGVRPDPAEVVSILKTMGQRWDALGLDARDGAFDYWVALAAAAHTQSPVTLWRSVQRLKELSRPRTLLYLSKMLALHVRGLPGHPIELFGESGNARRGFVDAAILADILPLVIDDFIGRLQDASAASAAEGSKLGFRGRDQSRPRAA